MRTTPTLTIAAALVMTSALCSAGSSTSASMRVSATNVGVFGFELDTASFNFGSVGATGAPLPGTNPAVSAEGRTVDGRGGRYVADRAATWRVTSAPRRVVTIYNDGATRFSGPAGADPSRLELRIPSDEGLVAPLGTGTTTGFRPATATGTGGGTLVDGMAVGFGALEARGELDLALTLLDTDPLGEYEWEVVLTAAAP